jgi:TonB family protein
MLQAIANAVASEWGQDPQDRAPRPAGYYPASRELAMQLPRLPRYGLGRSRLRAGDSTVALISYRAGQLPELDLSPDVRPELHNQITRAIGTAIANAANGRAIRDTFPLEMPGADGDGATIEVRFGWTPPQGAAVATFARRESTPRLRTSRDALRYPDEYRLQNIEGSVLAMFIITETGSVDRRSIRVISSDGPLFTESVIRFLMDARFEPYMLDCVAQPTVATQPFHFSLTR